MTEKRDRIVVMGHLIAGYPAADPAGFRAACRGLRDGGVEILELQIPFSDPTADGPVITKACEAALAGGFRVREIFDYAAYGLELGFREVHVMTYANIVHRWRGGVRGFVDEMDAAGITGMIVPDLPIEDEEGFYSYARERRISAVPVAVVNMRPDRLELLHSLAPSHCYVALRQGVTGSRTTLDPRSLGFIDRIRELLPPEGRIYAGFGIGSGEQVKALEGHADAAVVGSYITKVIGSTVTTSGSIEAIYRAVYQAANGLCEFSC